jgi:hypothetical protein
MKQSEVQTRRPKKLTESERTATEIFMNLVNRPSSKLYYDLKTSECYVRSEDGSIFIFLEDRNIKIINSVYSFDVHISTELEAYLTARFERELAIRRLQFKREALSKVEHSLENTLNKLLQ